LANGFLSLGTVSLDAGAACCVTISAEDAGGLATADAMQLIPVN
jgi:hypothetical protein